MWWRLGLLAVFDIVVAVGFFAPTTTMTVRIDLPPSAAPAPSPQAVQHGAELVGAVVGAVVILAMIALNVWVVQRVLRRRRGEL